MHIGIPREVKPLEGRVALIPAACAELTQHGHRVFLERGAGEKSGYSDAQYQAAGAEIVADAAAVYEAGQLIVKVKEPMEQDLRWLRPEHRLFCYLHLAANPPLARRLQDIGLTAVALEMVEEDDGVLPLLVPMSTIAGRLAIQVGAHLLHQSQGGKGVLLGGTAGTERGRVVVIGAGVAGGNAAASAAVLGAEVTVFDRKPERLAQMQALGPNVTTRYPYPDSVAEAVREADLLIGAVLLAGRRAPHVVSAGMVRAMQPGSVIVDISIDQGGCVETMRPTTYADPTYTWEGVVHFGVTNMPGAVPRTSTQALSAVLLPYVVRMAGQEWERDAPLQKAVSVKDGKIVHPALLN